MVGDGRAEVPGLEPSSSPRGAQALLPPPGQIQGWWKGPEQTAASAETHPGVTLDPSTGRGARQQQWEEGRSGPRDTGCRTNTAPEQAALPSPSLPRTPGVPSHMRVGVTGAEGAKKEQEAAAAEPREPFYCTAKQGMEGQRRKHLPQGSARPSQQEHGAGGTRPWEQEGAPPCPLCSPQALQHGPGSRIAQAGWMRRWRPCAVAEGLCPAQQGTSAPPGTLQPSPNPQGEPAPGANGAKGAF